MIGGTPDVSPATGVRFGLALSGGGFRASFFHIGVLARLAERDLLRRIEVISTVSGGSIVGVLYYLHVKNLLEHKADEAVERDDYIQIVQAIEEDFLWAAQRNIRARIFSHLGRNLAMCKPSYSRTSRIGELLEKFLYQPAWKGDLTEKQRIRLRDLLIQPHGASGDFRPDENNANRVKAKVPMLMINATTLNTGRNWRFEAVRMGESLATNEMHANLELDLNPAFFFQPAYFHERPPRKLIEGRPNDFPLGLAVAASAAVPGLFHPVAIKKLYDVETGKRKLDVSVELVDGGVHDNQGVQGLFDRDCTHLIVSDASGQYRPLHRPQSEIPAVLKRAMSLFPARLREEQLIRAELANTTNPVALVHLRRGLPAYDLFPLEPVVHPSPTGLTSFGINAEAQDWLSKLRTDLDNFGDVEAAALMLDGYKMMEEELVGGVDMGDGADPADSDSSRWHFRCLEHLVGIAGCQPRVQRRLKVGTQRFVKPLRFYPILGTLAEVVAGWILGFVIGASAVLIAAYILNREWWSAPFDWKIPAWVAAAVFAPLLLVASYIVQKPRQPTTFLVSRALPLMLSPFLWVMAWTQLVFNGWYLRVASFRSVNVEPSADHELPRVEEFSRRDRPGFRF